MNTKCKEIQYVLELSQEEGNSVKQKQKGWSEMNESIVMKDSLATSLKEKAQYTHPGLEYWVYDGSPLDPPDEGFACRKCSISISFPRKNKFGR
jgi:hypothetical protein